MVGAHLRQLEAESIHIIREVVAECERPVMLYSCGKDSTVMLHLARKAFYPSRPPFPLLHIDTTWKFREMITYRDRVVEKTGVELLVHVNQQGLAAGVDPFTVDPSRYTDVMKTTPLREALDRGRHDVALGGARRDEEPSRAKERIVSYRSAGHRWDPRRQRPEVWRLYNARVRPGECLRAFPLSNWTELDVWTYIDHERLAVVPLYFAAMRPTVERDGALIVVDDVRLPLKPGERPIPRRVRFRTLGCYPLTGAIASDAESVPAIIDELRGATTSERQGRAIDHDVTGSMERKKHEGYF